MVENYIDCLFNDKIILQPQQRSKSDCHNVYTEQINKIVLSSNDNKRLQIFYRITTFPHGINAFKMRETEMMIVKNLFVENYENGSFYVKLSIYNLLLLL